MVTGIGKFDTDDENRKKENNGINIPRYHLMIALVVLFIVISLIFFVMNLPGRYKAVVVSAGSPDEVLVLDTVKGNVWRYQSTKNITVVTYIGKLKAGKQVPDRKVIKQLD